MRRYAVILTHNRPELLAAAMRAIAPQVDRVIVVDNASEPPVRITGEWWAMNAELITDPTQPPNLAALWNEQLRRIAAYEDFVPDSTWEVALLCDDAITPPGWFDCCRREMRSAGAAAACTSAFSPIQTPIFKTEPDSDIYTRMTGWAFVVAGEKAVRADESMRWWWCDTDFDWRLRAAGGVVIAPGPVVPNVHPGGWTNAKPELGTQAGVDRARFAEKWGWTPW